MADPTAAPVGFLERPLFQGMILTILAILAYANSFHVPFVLDDVWITGNSVIHNLPGFFTADGYDEFPNRIVGYFTLAINYRFGGENVTGYHAVNLAIHITNALLVYSFVQLTFKTPLFTTPDPEFAIHHSPFTIHRFLPFLIALLFVCHPLQTQAVTYTVQRLTSLATLFYLATLVLHIRWRLSLVAGAAIASRSILPYYFLSLLMAVLAMKTKEIAFTLPLVVLLYEFSFFGVPDRKRMALFAPLLLTLCIIPLSMLSLHKPAGEILSDVSTATADQFAISRTVYLFTQFSVLVTYLRLLVLPINQNLDYDYPLNHSLLEPRTALSLLLLLGIQGLAVWLWRSGSRTNSPFTIHHSPLLRLAAFGIFWFFLTLSVESSVIPIRDVLFEHRVYLPSVGFFISVVTLLDIGARKLSLRVPSAGRVTAVILFIAALVLSVLTYSRNDVWRSEETLWQDSIAHSPNKARPWNNLGVVHAKQRRLAEAIPELEKAIRLDPTYLDGHLNLGQAYAVAELFPAAVLQLRMAVALSPPGDNAAREAMQELNRVLAAKAERARRSTAP